MSITLDISREYLLILLDHIIEDAQCCDDDVERAECERLADQLHRACYPFEPRPSLVKNLNPKPF